MIGHDGDISVKSQNIGKGRHQGHGDDCLAGAGRNKEVDDILCSQHADCRQLLRKAVDHVGDIVYSSIDYIGVSFDMMYSFLSKKFLS